MSLKSWVLDRVHRMGGIAARDDLPPHGATPTRASPSTPPPDAALSAAQHLGPYAPLIGAIRSELEHFVAGHVRLHLAIADRDRFLLTSIGVRCPDDGQARELLAQFMREFKPEQVKRYLVREVIAGLPNASALDLSQFAGLFDADATDDPGDYRELLVALRGNAPAATAAAYQVSVVGRWAEIDVASPVAAAAAAAGASTPSTPLAGQRCEFDVEDASGRRRVVLQAVVAGRRYVIGKGEGSDIRVDGTYTSRRHGELWLEDGAWWVTDAGSTNGLRVETPAGAAQRCAAGGAPVRLAEGARVVLSAQADGTAADYPTVMLRAPAGASRVTPIAGAASAPPTPLTPILAARGAGQALTLTARLATGERRLALHAGVLPVAVGRSRNQQLVIDRIHEAVSGHHLDIVDVDESGAQVVVHGDNGVIVEGVAYPPGARLRWRVGDTMVLGPALQGTAECTLVLSR
ncbi:MAG TPA: FHA domain-containing protein [Albitalea sp.]